MQTNDPENIEHLAHIILSEIRQRGIDTADVLVKRAREDSISVLQGQVETVRRKISRGVGIRVIVDQRLGFAHSSDVSDSSLSSLVDQAIALAKEASPDPGHGIAEPAPAPPPDELDMFDHTLLSMPVEEKIDQVLRLEKAMLASDQRIARSSGCNWSDGDEETVILNTLGLSHAGRGTGVGVIGQAVAEGNGQMQSGWWWTQSRHRSDLDPLEEVGAEAGKRAAALLGARRIATTKAPVLFEAPVASQVLSVLFSALNGETIRKRSSYLVDKKGEAIASELVTVIDDGYLPRKLGTQGMDDEGTPARKKTLVKKGILKQYVYDIRGARLSKTKPTGNAHRSYGTLPSVGPTNLYLKPGDLSREDLIKSVKNGLFLTRIMGSGVNLVTGDASWGGSGMWIENGELAYPVEGITIAGNLLNLWKNIDAVANDLDWRSIIASPTFRVSELMIGGK